MSLVTEVSYTERRRGDIGIHSGSSPLSSLIVEGERLAGEIQPGDFEASHIFIISDNTIFEAIFPTISLSPWNTYTGQHERVFRLNVTDGNIINALWATEIAFLGKHYDVAGCIVGMGYIEISRWLGKEVTNRFASQHAAWCSELATIYMQKLIPDDLRPSTTDPQQVLNYLQELAVAF